MSTQQLADALEEIGFEIKRPVLSNLENRRRGTVTVAEVYALSAVLQVPPTALLAPLGEVEAVEPLPGVEADPWTVYEWLRGRDHLPGGPPGPLEDSVRTMRQLDEHHEMVESLRPVVASMHDHRRDGDEEAAKRTRRTVAAIERALRNFRRQLRANGTAPPELPPELWPVDTPGALPGMWESTAKYFRATTTFTPPSEED